MIGCGAVGLNVLQGAKLVDAGQIIAVDVGKAKLDRAVQFGATHTVDGAARDVLDQIKALTDGRGADYVFEAAGNKRPSASPSKRCVPAARSCGWARSTSTKT